MIARSFGTRAGWADADFEIKGRQHRVWAPILAEAPDHYSNRGYTPEEIRLLFVPQLLDNWQVTFEMVRALVFGPWAYFQRDLTFRDECFIDRESCADQSSSGPAIAGFVADRILQRLIAAPAADRPRLRMELAMPIRNHDLCVSARLRELEVAAFGASED